MRRSFPLAVLGMLSLAMLVGSIIPSRAAGKDLHFVLDFMPDGFHAPFYAALEQGFYREEGVNVRISRGYGSGDTVRKIAAGQFDIGLAHLPAVIAARANEDAQIQAVMLYLTRDMLAIWVRDEGKINGPKDLEGKTVATTPGNAHFVMFPAFAKAVGFDAERIKWVTVDGAVMGPMLINKQVDAAPFFMSHGPRIVPQAAERGVKLKAFSYTDYGLQLYSTSVFARTETIKKDGDAIGRFVRGSLKGIRWTAQHPDEASRIVMKHNPEVTFEAVRGAWEVTKPFMFPEEATKDGQGRFEPNKLRTTIDLVHSGLKLKRMPTAEEMATNQFVPAP
jgi:NitT/TauT family transport system substrate-binding protein